MRDAILGRLRRAPRQADTAEGIANWWLPQAGIDLPRERVERLLRQLVGEGILVSHTLPDGTVLYSNAEHAAGPRDASGQTDDVSGHSRDE
jgi:hypothetical protein